MKESEQQNPELESENDDSRGTELRLPTASEVGWLFLGGGLVGCLVNLARRDHHLADWLLPCGFIGAGAALLTTQRRSRMEAAQEAILTQLDELDPIARAQVLKAVAKEELASLTD